MPEPLVAVVILNWNKAALTAACIEAVAGMDYPRMLTLVIDNGSEPGSLGPIEALKVPLELIRNPTNLGFTGGVNTGIRRALELGADYIWLLNNDAVPEADTLSKLVAAMEADPGIGMASPIIRNSDAGGEIDFCGGRWSGRTTDTTNDLETYLRWNRDDARSIWLVGTALLMRSGVVRTVGRYDDEFFAYWEDTDYSLRVVQAGYRNIVVPEAQIMHQAGAVAAVPSSKPPHYYYYMARNGLLLTRKHLGWWAGRRPLWWTIRCELGRARRLRHQPELADAILLGLFDGLTFRRGPYIRGRRVPARLRTTLLRATRPLATP